MEKLVNVTRSQLLGLVCIDHFHISLMSGTCNHLFITYHFSGYRQEIPSWIELGVKPAKAVFEGFFTHFFQERFFQTMVQPLLIKDLCAVLGVHKCTPTPYHVMGNRKGEINQMLLNILGSLDQERN